MARYMLDEEKLVKFVRRARERWEDFEVLKIIQKRSKQILYVSIRGSIVKLIIYPNGTLRSFGRPEGLAIAVKNILARVLGVELNRTESG
jgi:hypothetical protein